MSSERDAGDAAWEVVLAPSYHGSHTCGCGLGSFLVLQVPLSSVALERQTDRQTDRHKGLRSAVKPGGETEGYAQGQGCRSGWLGDDVVQEVQPPSGRHGASVPLHGCLAL